MMRPPRPSPRWMVAAVTLAVASAAIAGAGCSAVLARPPPDHPIRDVDECSSSVLPPIVDVVLAGGLGAVGAVELLSGVVTEERAGSEIAPSWDAHHRATDRGPIEIVTGLLFTAAATAATVSAGHGFGGVKRCRVARRELRQRQLPMFDPRGAGPPFSYPPPAWPPQEFAPPPAPPPPPPPP